MWRFDHIHLWKLDVHFLINFHGSFFLTFYNTLMLDVYVTGYIFNFLVFSLSLEKVAEVTLRIIWTLLQIVRTLLFDFHTMGQTYAEFFKKLNVR